MELLIYIIEIKINVNQFTYKKHYELYSGFIKNFSIASYEKYSPILHHQFKVKENYIQILIRRYC